MSKKVSVCVATYNQEKYIAQAVESALNQQVNFDYEIVVGEDCSTDSTREILISLQKAYPERLRLLLHQENLGLAGKRNIGEILRNCQGEYIALLDGDDYWTNSQKLQKQVDFLDGHADFAMCFHNATVVHEDDEVLAHDMLPAGQPEVSTLTDLLRGNFIPTCSAMHRRALLSELPDWYYTMSSGDWALHVLSAAHGKVKYMNEVMAVYRVHKEGYWMGQDHYARVESEMRIFEAFDKHFKYRYRKIISQAVAERAELLTKEYEKRGEVGKAKKYALRYFSERLRDGHVPDKYQLLRLFYLHFPTLHRGYYNLKRRLRGDQARL